MRRIVPTLASIVFGLALAFGGVQVSQATAPAPAAAADHCETVPGPDVHCDGREDCLEACEGATFIDCTDGCCECIF